MANNRFCQNLPQTLGLQECHSAHTFLPRFVSLSLHQTAIQGGTKIATYDTIKVLEGKGRVGRKGETRAPHVANDIIRRLQPQLAKVRGTTLFPQPVQDLTVEDRVNRTQYQYSIECPDPNELYVWAPRLVAKLQTLPQLRDVASDQQTGGLEAVLVIDRDTASRLGITPQTVDDTLYNAFGQRQVSTIFTQLNQ